MSLEENAVDLTLLKMAIARVPSHLRSNYLKKKKVLNKRVI